MDSATKHLKVLFTLFLAALAVALPSPAMAQEVQTKDCVTCH